MTWYEKYTSGKLLPLSQRLGSASETFDEAISQWQQEGQGQEIHEFLGLTQAQYEFILWSGTPIVPTPEQAEWYAFGYRKGLSDGAL